MPHFSELSTDAQDAIVAVIMGETVPPLPQSVRDEIQAWAETDDFARRPPPHPVLNAIQRARGGPMPPLPQRGFA